MRTSLWLCLALCLIWEMACIRNVNHCIGQEAPLQLQNPFDIKEELDDGFARMVWSFAAARRDASTADVVEVLVVDRAGVWPKGIRYQVFGEWGLQVNNVTMSDAGRYTATLVSKPPLEERSESFDVIVAEVPILMTDGLRVIARRTPSGQRLICGRTVSLGNPPVQLVWIAPNSTVLGGRFQRGMLTIELGKREDIYNFKCQVDFTSPAAKCIPLKKLWTSSYPRKPLRTEEITPNRVLIFVTIFVASVAGIVSLYVYQHFQRSLTEKNVEEIRPTLEWKGNDDSSCYDSENALNKFDSCSRATITVWGYLPTESTDPIYSDQYEWHREPGTFSVIN
ncbi:hypothetical protein EGW08_005674 [Elysia chlorotica]|uniref:Ig-like domain-containing protein n=1 Tax=Elysia chlorotica TaxID=188477 RepID=A0A433TYB9_ELYCH|nr:hypothetical protein EGW08_005674 [Elysia chlorotica]